MRVYSLCADDLNFASMGGPVGIRGEAIYTIITLLDVDIYDRAECFKRVKLLGKYIAGYICQR